jgi:hypothetical protein
VVGVFSMYFLGILKVKPAKNLIVGLPTSTVNPDHSKSIQVMKSLYCEGSHIIQNSKR